MLARSHHFSIAFALLLALFQAPAAAQSPAASCTGTAPATPTLSSLTTPSSPEARSLRSRPSPLADALRHYETTGRARFVANTSAPPPPCRLVSAARGEALLESTLLQEYFGENWDNLSRGLYTYDEADSLASYENQLWNGSDWQHDWIESWVYDAQGRVTEHAFTSEFFGVESGWRERFIRDASGLLTESYYDINDNGAWFEDGWYVYTYTPDGLLASVTGNLYDGAGWVPSTEETFTYDAEGRLLTALVRNYDGLSESWMPLGRSTWTYEAEARTRLGERWIGGGWQNDYIENYTLDAWGNTTLYLAQVWEEGAWENSLRQTLSYAEPAEGLRSESEVRWWGGIGEDGGLGDVWADGWNIFYVYDDDLRLVDYTYLTGVGIDVWENTLHRTYTFSGDRLVEEVDQVGDEAGGWVNQIQTYNFYDENTGTQTEQLMSRWDGEAWTIERRILFTYQSATDVAGEPSLAPLDLDVFPNPATDVTIALTLDHAAPVEIEVVDVLGRRVARLLNGETVAGSERLRWRPEGLAPGLYFVRLRAGEQTAVRPVTIVR
jgi:hypothetical protein